MKVGDLVKLKRDCRTSPPDHFEEFVSKPWGVGVIVGFLEDDFSKVTAGVEIWWPAKNISKIMNDNDIEVVK